MSEIKPTQEQQAILDAFKTGENIVVEALAGSGKTSTLRMMSEETDKAGLYVAYNKAIQTDAAKDFPSHVDCRTAHSLAYRATMQRSGGKALLNRLRSPRLPSRQAVALLGIPEGGFQDPDGKMLAPWIISRSAFEAVKRFCNSADEEIQPYHVPKVEGIEDMASYRAYVAPYARKAWEDLNSSSGRLTYTHDCYLKQWALTHPKIDADFIMLDEAQDASPVIAQLVSEQTHAQLILVGDRNQQIYAWRGAVDAMQSFSAPHRLPLTKSFRFGPAVAERANVWLSILNSPHKIEGFEKLDSKVESLSDPDAILCRTNAAVIQQAMAAQDRGRRVAITGGTAEIKSFTEGACDLISGRKSGHSDLVAFKTWGDVQAYAASEEGTDLRVMVKLIDDYGVDSVLAVCEASVSEEKADLIVSTLHKCKGRQWPKVQIGHDIKAPEEGLADAEAMLLYVGVTRAQMVLDDSALSWVDSL